MNEIQRINEANCSEANRLREKFGLDLLTWWFLEDYGVSAGKGGRQERGSGPTMEAAVNEALAKMDDGKGIIVRSEVVSEGAGLVVTKHVFSETFAKKLSVDQPPPWWKGMTTMVKIRPVFAWYDIWVGVFIDKPKRRVYVFPIPCVGLVVEY
jgi:hypothetical protein